MRKYLLTYHFVEKLLFLSALTFQPHTRYYEYRTSIGSYRNRFHRFHIPSISYSRYYFESQFLYFAIDRFYLQVWCPRNTHENSILRYRVGLMRYGFYIRLLNRQMRNFLPKIYLLDDLSDCSRRLSTYLNLNN